MKLTMEEHGDDIRKWLKQGASYRDIAAEFGCHHTTVASFVKRNLSDARRRPQQPAAPRPLKILAIDIETSPNLVWTFPLYGDVHIGPDQIVEPTRMLCFAAKWLGDPVIRFYSEQHDGREKMVEQAHTLLNQADAVLHFNGKSFDTKHLQREFVEAGMPPTSPFKQIDMLLAVRRQFRFPTNKLAYVAPQLGLDDKVKHEGFRLWTACIAGDKAAWKRMREYNIQDVQLLEDLYDRLLPWIVDHPSLAAVLEDDVCPRCGCDHLEPAGVTHTQVSTFAQFYCPDCGTYSRGTKRIGKTTLRTVARG